MGDESLLPIFKERFTALWKRCLIPGIDVDPAPVCAGLLRRYSQPYRHYHNCTHLWHCFQQLDLAAGLMQDPDAVEMAIWFHDVICELGAPDNERRSAELFARTTRQCFPPVFVRRVYDLILVTTHDEHCGDCDEEFVVDIDLSSFGSPWEDFLRDTQAVRKEQDHVRDEVFYPAHTKFLNSLLKRPRIFCSDFFRARYEHTARQNIGRLLAQRRSEGYG